LKHKNQELSKGSLVTERNPDTKPIKRHQKKALHQSFDSIGNALRLEDHLLALKKNLLRKRLYETKSSSGWDNPLCPQTRQFKDNRHDNLITTAQTDLLPESLQKCDAGSALQKTGCMRHSCCNLTCLQNWLDECCHSCQHAQKHGSKMHNKVAVATPSKGWDNEHVPSPSTYLKHLIDVRRQVVRHTRMLGDQV
jgi:hypothetical protein